MAGLPLIGKPWFDRPWIDGTQFVPDLDFLNFWMGGRSVFGDGPATWFDVATYNAALRDLRSGRCQ